MFIKLLLFSAVGKLRYYLMEAGRLDGRKLFESFDLQRYVFLEKHPKTALYV